MDSTSRAIAAERRDQVRRRVRRVTAVTGVGAALSTGAIVAVLDVPAASSTPASDAVAGQRHDAVDGTAPAEPPRSLTDTKAVKRHHKAHRHLAAAVSAGTAASTATSGTTSIPTSSGSSGGS
jgi:hypothetical protein